MKRIKQIIIGLALVVGLGVVATPVTVGAVNVFTPCSTSSGAVCAGKSDSVNGIIKNVVNAILMLLGAVSVVMIIIGGFRYTVSGGDSSGITSAKNTILYAVVGLVVAFLAYAIVNWVVVYLNGATAPTIQQQCASAGKTYNAKTKICK